MTIAQLLRSKEFSQVAEVRADAKNRLPLKKVKAAGMYRIYENAQGQLILDPVLTIPAVEAWLFADKDALSSVRKGLQESAEGKLVKKVRKGRTPA
jgi:hypothetical protein